MPNQSASHPETNVLLAFAANRLPAPEAEAVARHLQTCPACRDLSEQLTVANLSGTPTVVGNATVPNAAGGTAEQPLPVPDIPPELSACTKYRILRRLGAGGLGEVYLAEQPEMGRLVALKVIRPDLLSNERLLQRFFTEVKEAVRLSLPPHPSIAATYDRDRVGDRHVVVVEYVEGIDLGSLVMKKGPLPVRLACELLRQASLALAYAHAQTPPIFHRDIKPSHLMVMKNRQVKILDFGLARLGRGDPESDGPVRSAVFLGTAEYVAPEQAFDVNRADARSDIYSLGCTLYLLLTGAPPFRGIDAVMQRMLQEPEPLHQKRAEVPEALSLVAAGMLAKRVEERYRTAAEVAQALRPFCSTESPAGPLLPKVPAAEAPRSATTEPAAGPGSLKVEKKEQPSTAWAELEQPAGRSARRRRWPLVGGAVVLVGLLAVLWFRRDLFKDVAAPPSFENSVEMRMVGLPGGTFTMGSPKEEVERGEDEDQHTVEISPFYLSRTEVTQKQFRKVMGYNPSYFSNNARGKEGATYGQEPGGGKESVKGEDTEEFPVDNVSWDEANEFCRKLTDLDQSKRRGWVYRLPTEAEWEYACRGGSRPYQTYYFGDSISSRKANFDHNPDRTTRVGSYQGTVPHPFGLWDVHGNAWEWCADWYDENYYKTSPREDPPGPAVGSYRVVRGGCWRLPGRYCRSACRVWYAPANRDNRFGFRAALVPVERR
jgi:formylglycine-generating enzyme required for sulfatase activity